MAIERLDIENCTDRLQNFLHRERYDFVLSQLGKREHVLEIGTGVGVFARELAPRCESYVGIEFDSAACAEARRRTQGKARILEADARSLPFADKQFSFIVCLEVLEHLGDWQAGVQQIHRCLKNDGAVIISVPYRQHGGRSKINKYHLYEPGETELTTLLNQLFVRLEIRYQFFEESLVMSVARKLHIRRLVGLAQLYGDLANGESSALNRLGFNRRPRGMKIGLVILARGKK